jgi:hypothetical protein
MNEIISNLHELEKETIKNIGNSKSKNTLQEHTNQILRILFYFVKN